MNLPGEPNRPPENKEPSPSEELVDGLPVNHFLYGIPYSLEADVEECLVSPEDFPGAAGTAPSPQPKPGPPTT
jgi:hypothetical protein